MNEFSMPTILQTAILRMFAIYVSYGLVNTAVSISYYLIVLLAQICHVFPPKKLLHSCPLYQITYAQYGGWSIQVDFLMSGQGEVDPPNRLDGRCRIRFKSYRTFYLSPLGEKRPITGRPLRIACTICTRLTCHCRYQNCRTFF